MGWLASLFRKPRPAPDKAAMEACLDARLAQRKANRERMSAAARAGAATKARNRIANDPLRREMVRF